MCELGQVPVKEGAYPHKDPGLFLAGFFLTVHSAASCASRRLSGDEVVEAFWNCLFLWPALAVPGSLVRFVLRRQPRGNAER